jgi:RNA polymerase sigma factor (sigma-70 family)
MTPSPTPAILRHLRGLLAAEQTGQLSDSELLERFAMRREEAAFAALVRRHGPLVLGVCRRVLHNRQDAEDAFQAAFLALACHAATVGRRGSAGGWLHRVAYRTALKARMRAARREEQERHVPQRTCADPLTEVSGRELLGLLDEELQRLPDEYREPLVLCYLQGKTRDEAARDLGCSLGTLKRRLEQGRELLRVRLSARGLALPATLVTAALVPEAGSAAVPATLAAAAVQAALLAKCAVVPAIAELSEGALPGVGATKLKTAVVLLLALGAAILGAAALGPERAANPAAAAPPPASVPAEKQSAAVDETKKVTVGGRVLDPSGKPLADASVMVWARHGLIMSTGEWWAAYRNDMLGEVKTDQEGRYRLKVPRTDPDFNVRSIRVVVMAPGHGLAWKALKPDATEAEAELRLPPVQRVSGHITGLQGEDAADVTIHVEKITRKPGQGERDEDATLRPPDGSLTAKSDARGNFVFDAFGPDMTLELEVRDPRYELKTDWQVNTADKKACENIRLLLGQGRYVEGQVVYQDTGKPVPHARLMLSSPIIEAKTDKEGRFKIPLYTPREGDAFMFFPRDVSISAWPPPGEPYLGNGQGVDFPKGVVRREVKIALPRAALLRGKVREAGSGKAVAGARVAYNAGYDYSVASGPDGSYQIGVPPGQGRLFVSHPSGEYIPRIVGSAGGTLDKPIGDRAYHHAVLDVEVKKEEKATEVDVTLRRGVTVKGRLLRPDDKPVASAVMFVSEHRPRFENWMHPILVRDARFEIRGLDPEKTYRVTFLEHPRLPPAMITPESLQGFPQLYLKELLGPEKKLGQSLEVSPKKLKDEMVVKLAACGKARLRFVDGAGKQLANYSPWLQLVVTPGPRIYQALEEKKLAAEVVSLTGRYGGQLANNPTDADGYVTLEGLIPGATYWVKKNDQEPINEILKEFTTEAGKTLELTITVK